VSYETLTLERRGPVLHVWLDRPERRNALNGRALDEIADCFGALQRDFATRVVVLGGRGLSFCGGADRKDPPAADRLAGSSDATERERRYAAQIGRRACEAILRCEAVTIARIHGHAVGGGLALALACDFRIAAAGTRFHVPEVDLGIPLSWGAVPRLVHEVGAARAREIILLCDPFDAARAEAIGLVHRCVSEAALDGAVEDWAQRLAAKPEAAVHMTKTQLRAYAAIATLGDVSESDGDLLREASRGAAARAAFRGLGRS